MEEEDIGSFGIVFSKKPCKCKPPYFKSKVVGIHGATGKVSFAFNSVVLYIEQICNLTGNILRDDDFPFELIYRLLYSFRFTL